jgi:hemerythrin
MIKKGILYFEIQNMEDSVMTYYEWSKDLETGNDLIDSQHKELVQAVNNLLSACANGKGREEIVHTVDFLSEYTVKHFSDEEVLQNKYKYPEYLNHKKLHKDFTLFVRDLAEQIKKNGPTLILVGKVNSHIGDWLVNHIKKEDSKVAAHIRASDKKTETPEKL